MNFNFPHPYPCSGDSEMETVLCGEEKVYFTTEKMTIQIQISNKWKQGKYTV